MHRTPRALLAGVVLWALLRPSPAGAEYFTISAFESQITVRGNATLWVRERIAVTFSAPRHGIYRDLPVRFTTEMGHAVDTPTRVLSVTDDQGASRPWTTRREGDALRVRIGDPDRLVEGAQSYVLTYAVAGALLFMPDRDELYWNVTGNGWDTTIAEASATVVVEGADTDPGFQAACYSGEHGATGRDCTFDLTPRGARFSTTRPLAPREGLTVALGWRKGVVPPPSALRRLWWRLGPGVLLPALLPLTVFVFAFRRWRATGRDPDVGDTVTPVFTPPELAGRPLTPAEAGVVADERLDHRDLTATLVHLAVTGHLTIEEVEKEGLLLRSRDYLLTRTASDAALPPFERELLDGLFADGPTVTVSSLANRFYRRLPALKSAIYGGLAGAHVFAANPETTTARWLAAGIGVLVGGLLLSGPLSTWAGFNPLGPVVAALLSGGILIGFARAMPARTRRGALLRLRVRGFEEFLGRAEKDRLERMADPRLFEKYLPYALALDVVDRWAAAFEGVWQETPQWYRGPAAHGPFAPAPFSRSLHGALAAAGTAMYAAPRSRGGSSGGGSSGGGFGGGGGGSW